ncbi:MAG: hypothetical protein HQ508_02925 [Candidatus Marinimicrobia bacterium]|nr:hypothetical protein [Candidatus Neomarinimicrobiota bacterium]
MTTTAENGGRREKRDTMKVLKMLTLLSLAMIVIGVIIVIVVGYVEDDPIIPPVLMIVIGIGWFVRTRIRIRWHQKSLLSRQDPI